MKLIQWPVRATAAFCLALAFGSAAQASTPSELLDVANMVTSRAVELGDAVEGEGDQNQLASVLALGGADSSAADAAETYASVLAKSWQGSIGNTQEMIERVRPLATNFLLGSNGEDGLAMGQALLPYMIEGGYCSGEPTSADGALCAFTFGTEAASIAAELGEVSVKRVDPDSTLGGILAATGPQLPLPTASAMASPAPSYSYMGITIRAPYAYYYIYRWRCYTSCRASVAAYGAVNGKYLTVGSDMVFASASAALYCDFWCSVGTAWAALNGRDFIKYALTHGDKRHPAVQGASKAIHAIATGCGAEPTAYSASPAYLALKDQAYELPYDLGVKIKFGTYYQTSTANPTLATPNLYPLYSSWKAASPGTYLTWDYNFSKLVAWYFNIIFAAVDNADVAGLCRYYVPMSTFVPGATGGAYGSQFWLWSGSASGDSDYGFPGAKVMFGFSGGT